MVHHGHPRRHPLAHHRPRGESPVGVERFNPVVIFNAQLFRVGFAKPDDRPAARQRQHQQVFAIGGVDPPLLVRRQEIQRFFRKAVWRHGLHLADAAGINGRAIGYQAFAEGAHPRMVLIQVLAAGEGAPWDQLMHVGITGIVGDVLAFQSRPRRAGDNFARLRLNIAKADLLILFIERQMGMIAAGKLSQRLPGFHRHLAVGFRGEAKNNFGGVNGAVDPRPAFGRTVGLDVVKLAEEIDFALRIPRNAFPAVAKLIEQRAERGEAFPGGRIVAFHQGNRRCGFPGDQIAFALAPVKHLERLRQFAGGIMLQRDQHHIGLFAKMADADLREGFSDILVDLPVAFRLPGRVDGGGERVDKRVHVRGVHIVFFIPGGGRQDNIGEETGTGHAEIQRHQQVEFSLNRRGLPLDFLRFYLIAGAQFITLNTAVGPEQVFQHVLMPLTGRSQQV